MFDKRKWDNLRIKCNNLEKVKGTLEREKNELDKLCRITFKDKNNAKKISCSS